MQGSRLRSAHCYCSTAWLAALLALCSKAERSKQSPNGRPWLRVLNIPVPGGGTTGMDGRKTTDVTWDRGGRERRGGPRATWWRTRGWRPSRSRRRILSCLAMREAASAAGSVDGRESGTYLVLIMELQRRLHYTASLSHLRTMLPESSSCPQPAQWPNHAT